MQAPSNDHEPQTDYLTQIQIRNGGHSRQSSPRLGLMFEPVKAPVDVMVIDHIGQPTAN